MYLLQTTLPLPDCCFVLHFPYIYWRQCFYHTPPCACLSAFAAEGWVVLAACCNTPYNLCQYVIMVVLLKTSTNCLPALEYSGYLLVVMLLLYLVLVIFLFSLFFVGAVRAFEYQRGTLHIVGRRYHCTSKCNTRNVSHLQSKSQSTTPQGRNNCSQAAAKGNLLKCALSK